MLVLAIIATVFLSLKIILGWLAAVSYYSEKDKINPAVNVEFCKGVKSFGLVNIFLIVVIWILYANIG